MIFIRILDNKAYYIQEVNELGFEKSEKLRIPDIYLNNKIFTVLRTAKGIGDWGIISSMPRLLKQKYPDCKVYIPSNILYKKLFNVDTKVMYDIFSNNPYVDGFKDHIEGEIFHDHYRIYDNNNPNIPLIEQILKFWQFEENEYKDSQPEIYWSKEEKELGNNIIKKYVGNKEFGCLLISERFGTQFGKYDEKSFINDNSKIIKLLNNNKLPYFYWTYKPLNQFNFNISNQCGTNHCVVRYSDVYEIQRQSILGHNFVRGENYL